jgi:hypothetical protein
MSEPYTSIQNKLANIYLGLGITSKQQIHTLGLVFTLKFVPWTGFKIVACGAYKCHKDIEISKFTVSEFEDVVRALSLPHAGTCMPWVTESGVKVRNLFAHRSIPQLVS